MARARTIKGRIEQVNMWLYLNYPTKLPVKVRWVDELIDDPDPMTGKRYPYYADTSHYDDRVVIRMSRKKNRNGYTATETFLHEWNHAQCGPGVNHSDTFWRKYGVKYRHFYEKGGADEADEL